MTTSRTAYFASWRCNCTILATSADEIADLCPTHGKSLLGPREFVEVDTSAPLGIEPDHRVHVTLPLIDMTGMQQWFGRLVDRPNESQSDGFTRQADEDEAEREACDRAAGRD